MVVLRSLRVARLALGHWARVLNWIRLPRGGWSAGLLTLVGVLGCALPSTAQAGEPEVVEEWLRRQTKVVSWTADFTQTRQLPALTRPLTSPGRVWFSAPDRFRWELGEPVQSVAVRQGDDLLLLSPKLARAESVALGQLRGPARDALALLDTGFPRDAATFRQRFAVKSQETTNGLHTLQLQPLEPGVAQWLKGLRITLAAEDYTLKGTELRFADGTILRNEFHHAVSNPEIPTERFSVAVPPGYTVGQPGR
jgi:outer membrane lipoprotein-sorting protein